MPGFVFYVFVLISKRINRCKVWFCFLAVNVFRLYILKYVCANLIFQICFFEK